MTDDKMIKKILFTLVTILAIFCVSNVKAAVRTAGSLSDDGDGIKSTSSSGTVSTSNGPISGTSCSLFNVSVDHNASLTSGGHACGKSAKCGPYIENQGNIVYKVEGAGNGCESSYVAFCLDPNFDGVKTGATIQYKAEPINPNSVFGRRIYALYKKYQIDGSPTDDSSYFKYEVAARIIAVQADSDYQSRSNTAKARHNSHLGPYISGSVPGTVGQAAYALAMQAMSDADSDATIQEAQNSTLGVRMNQLGGASYNGSSYGVLVNVTIENCQSASCASFGDLSFNMGVTQQGEGVYDEGAKTLTFTVAVEGLGTPSGDSCNNANLEVTLNYKSSGDVRNAMQISPVSKTNDDRQNYVVFAKGGDGGGQVRNQLPISNCGPGNGDCTPGDENCPNPGPEVDSCEAEMVLACDNEDENFAVVNEGDNGGGTDWAGCIIGHTDTQGNSYDVVNTSKLYRQQATDQRTIEANALGDRTDAILGYTSDTSGGGTLSGDPHSIDDSDFCVISCKEKYAFILPGYKTEVKQGTYFSFQVDGQDDKHAVVGVSAERACVSSGIKNQSFNTRALDLRKQQVDFYNMYLYYRQLYDAMNSKEAMNKYRSDSAEQKVEVNLKSMTEKPSYNVQGAKHNGKDAEDAIRAESEFNNNNWIKEWSGGDIKVSVRYCKIEDPNNLNSKINCENYKDVPLNASFASEQGLGKALLQIPDKRFDIFYEKYYSDYAAAWNTVMHVGEYSKTYSESSSIVAHNYQYCTGKTHISSEIRNAIDFETPDGYESAGDGDYYTGCFKTSKDYYATVKYLPEYSTKLKSQWTNYKHTDEVYKKYNEAMTALKNAYSTAKNKYDALNAQIGIQSDAMQECTNYLDNFSQEKNPYRFDPVITFSYPDQPTYMAMLSPNRLVNMNEGTPEVKYEKFFCPGGGEGASVFSCGGDASSLTNFQFGDLYSDPAEGLIDSVSQAKDTHVPKKIANDVTEYYNVGSVGSRSTYGRFDANGNSGCSSSFNNGKGSKGDYCYEFYHSAKQFFVQAPDGIVTTESSGANKTILSTDGRVYPVSINTPEGDYPFYVTFSNIGQFTESTSLGRIMGGGDGKAGTLQGELGDTEVCFYDVCRIDDPFCGGDPEYCYDKDNKKVDISGCLESGKSRSECEERYCPDDTPPDPNDDNNNNKCVDILKNDCNNSNITDPLRFGDDKYEACLVKLMQSDEDCCTYVKSFKDIRNGKWNKMIPGSIWEVYNRECNATNSCNSFTIVSSEYYNVSTNLSDMAIADNDGSLQINARAVSLNNLFPNDQKGINWQTAEAKTVITEIQQEGEGIFGKDPDYKATVNAQCAAAIKAYNDQEEGDSSGYGNGGFNDYTNTVTDATVKELSTGDLEKHSQGTTVVMSDEFRALLENSCNFNTTKIVPDEIDDSVDSTVVKEPWQYR